MRIADGFAGLALVSIALAGPVGPEACRACHPAEYAAQTVSHHARALRPILETPLPMLLGEASIQERSGLMFEYQRQPGGLGLAIRKGPERLDALLTWAFGSGAQAYTPVGVRDGQYFEHRVSYYTAAGRPGRTMGHPGDISNSLDSALGIVQSAETIFRCFNCHATGVQTGPVLAEMLAGVTCERCHGNGAAHIDAARSGAPKSEVVRATIALSRLDAKQSVQFCATCHRSPADSLAVEPERADPLSIRYQPVGLMASKCFQKSGRLSCINCHNPHQNTRNEPRHYSQICLSCHTSVQASGPNCRRLSGQSCLPCHMQKRSPAEFLAFTDHRIRIYR